MIFIILIKKDINKTIILTINNIEEFVSIKKQVLLYSLLEWVTFLKKKI